MYALHNVSLFCERNCMNFSRSHSERTAQKFFQGCLGRNGSNSLRIRICSVFAAQACAKRSSACNPLRAPCRKALASCDFICANSFRMFLRGGMKTRMQNQFSLTDIFYPVNRWSGHHQANTARLSTLLLVEILLLISRRKLTE